MASPNQCFRFSPNSRAYFVRKQIFSAEMALAALSSALYGFNLSLALGCLKQTWRKRRTYTSKGRLWGSCLYVCLMIAFASFGIIQFHVHIINTITSSFLNVLPMNRSTATDPHELFSDVLTAETLTLSIWGADGVLVSEIMLSDLVILITMFFNVLWHRFGDALSCTALSALVNGPFCMLSWESLHWL